ncbi:hypothetical protein HDU82_009123, partial [Entophlyctis luteolus]
MEPIVAVSAATPRKSPPPCRMPTPPTAPLSHNNSFPAVAFPDATAVAALSEREARTKVEAQTRTCTPGYDREQIPRLASFISVAIFHVWRSRALAETLDIAARNRNILLSMFVKNVLELTRIPLPVVTLALKYMHRVRNASALQASEGASNTSGTDDVDATRAFSVALVLAQKFTHDAPYSARAWCSVAGLGAAHELAALERAWLARLRFRLHVHAREYAAFCQGVHALAREWSRAVKGVGAGVGSSAGVAQQLRSSCDEAETATAAADEQWRHRKAATVIVVPGAAEGGDVCAGNLAARRCFLVYGGLLWTAVRPVAVDEQRRDLDDCDDNRAKRARVVV